MHEYIDRFLNRITMYRLVLFVLIAELVMGGILAGFGLLPFTPSALGVTTALVVVLCVVTNFFVARFLRAAVNPDSSIITGLILVLMITPIIPTTVQDFGFLWWVAVLAVVSKFIVASDRDHIFNPATFAAVLTSIMLGRAASWWVGSAVMLPIVLIGGVLIVRKIQRFDLVFAFLVAALVMIAVTAKTGGVWYAVERALVGTSLFFFATIMLTEPLTTPPRRWLRILYGALVGVLWTPAARIGQVFLTPELTLLIGNFFSYIISPTGKFILTLKERVLIAKDTYEFVFTSSNRISFRAGQYMEWTLPHRSSDSRGVRRYFTVASSPKESDVRVGVKFYPESSTFKKQMCVLVPGDRVTVGEIAGDFTLPRDATKKLAFLAGGIGITPFRSMIQDMIDRKESRSVTLLYSTKTTDDIAYQDFFTVAAKQIGIKIVYVSKIDRDLLIREIPDYKERLFYISGPHSMVDAFQKTLRQMSVPRRSIKVDYFPGFA